jgi:hypothetical protein
VRGCRHIILLGSEGAHRCNVVAFFRSTVPLFCESIALVGASQEGVDGILSGIDHRLALARDVVPTICGPITCVGGPLATAQDSLTAFGGIPAMLARHQWIHNFLRGLGRLGHVLSEMLDSICRRVKIFRRRTNGA